MKAILFDLDGTLLPMDQDLYTKYYFKLLTDKLKIRGYKPEVLVKNIWEGIKEIIQNDGTLSNEDVFWNHLVSFYGQQVKQDFPFFLSFYENEYLLAKKACGLNLQAKQTIDLLKQNYRIVLATNPIYPAKATLARIQWSGCDPLDFEYISTYENSHSCKPNLKYYKELLQKLGLSANECLMVGNDVSEDMVANKLGMDVFLLTDCLINTKNIDISQYAHGNFDDLLAYIASKK